MRVLAVIPARGGSKGVPRKNIRLLCGKPLITYTIEAALKSDLLTRVILSTDDEEIASVGRAEGVDIPFIRPPELAQDNTPSLPVIIHAVQTLESQGEFYDAICILQPTHPLRTTAMIDACIEILIKSDATAVVSVLPIPDHHNPHWVYFRNPEGYLQISTGEANPIPRRQDLPPAYFRDGSIYLTRRDTLMVQQSLYGERVTGHVLGSGPIVNIDTLADWAEAEKRICECATK